MTWNEYLDEIISIVKVSKCGICTIASVDFSGYPQYNYRLETYIDELPLPNDPITLTKWPSEDRQSRIDFLNSLKDKE